MRKFMPALLLVALAPMHALAADINAGKAKATVCAGCHGPQGESSNVLWPDLAGQKEQYMLKQLRDYKTGARKDPLMTPQANALSEADMANVAAYFASLPCK